MTFRYTLLLVAALGVLASCKKSDDDHAHPAGDNALTLHFQNVVGDVDLTTNTRFTTTSGDTFTVASLQYYVSHLVLKKDDGSTYTVPADSSFFLVRTGDLESQDLTLTNVPTGTYTGASFVLGIDSASSFGAGTKPEVVEPGNAELGGSMAMVDGGLVNGYAFYQVAGTSFDGTGPTAYNFQAAGKRAEPQSQLKTVTLNFPESAIVGADRHPEAHVLHDLRKTFAGPGGAIWFWSDRSGPSQKIADNAAASFIVAHVHND